LVHVLPNGLQLFHCFFFFLVSFFVICFLVAFCCRRRRRHCCCRLGFWLLFESQEWGVIIALAFMVLDEAAAEMVGVGGEQVDVSSSRPDE
jgi:hypothetical protein